MKMFYYLFLAVAVIALIACGENRKPGSHDAFRTVDTREFAALIDSADVQLLDVRTQAEYDESHIKNAAILDWHMPNNSFIATAEKMLNKKKTVAIYCRSGRRSASAAALLSTRSFKVVNLGGGIVQWTADGKPVVK